MKIEFDYSPIFDNLLTDMCRKKYLEDKFREMNLYKEELEATWKKDENKITKEIENISKLKFKRKNIKSLVILKNENQLLPISKSLNKIYIAGGNSLRCKPKQLRTTTHEDIKIITITK